MMDLSGQQPADSLPTKSAVPLVHGTAVTARTQCAHYHSERDIIAIQMHCCRQFYACIECHREAALA